MANKSDISLLSVLLSFFLVHNNIMLIICPGKSDPFLPRMLFNIPQVTWLFHCCLGSVCVCSCADKWKRSREGESYSQCSFTCIWVWYVVTSKSQSSRLRAKWMKASQSLCSHLHTSTTDTAKKRLHALGESQFIWLVIIHSLLSFLAAMCWAVYCKLHRTIALCERLPAWRRWRVLQKHAASSSSHSAADERESVHSATDTRQSVCRNSDIWPVRLQHEYCLWR